MKIRNTYMTIAALAAYILSSCTAEIEDPNGFEKIEDGTILAEIPAYHRADQGTKANISDDLSVFTWSNGDQIGVEYSDGITDAFTRYTILKGGSSIGSFRNDAFRLRQDSEYYVTYPSADYDYPATLFMNFRGQFQSANNSAAHIGPRNYMTAIVRTDANHSAKFKFQNQAAVLQITFALPKDTEIKSLEIESLRKELILESFIQTKSNQYIPLETSSSLEMFFGTEIHGPGIKVKAGEPFVANMLFSRIDLYGSELVFTVRDVEGNVVKTFHDSGKRIDAGNAYSFGTTDVVIEPDPDAEYVDLGLSVMWATCNLGAAKPEEYGLYYQWGDTQGYGSDTSDGKYFDWSDGNGNVTYKWCNGSYNSLTKYNTVSSYGTVDNKTVLDMEDDAARAALGGNWRMPTGAEWTELKENCTWTWTKDYNGTGVAGRIVTSNKTGYTNKSIFLPAAGCRYDDGLDRAGSSGFYWFSSTMADFPYFAWRSHFTSDDVDVSWVYSRCLGLSVRPVYTETEATPSISVTPTDLNFGTVTVGSSAQKTFTVTNTGSATTDVVISTPSEPFTADFSGNISLNPGASKTVTVTFTPKDGNQYRDSMTIRANASNGTSKTVALSGGGDEQAKAMITIDEEKLNFGVVTVGENKTLTFKVTNTGSAPLQITKIGVTATDCLSVSPTSMTVDANGGSKTVSVTYQPTSEGYVEDVVFIKSNAANYDTKYVLISGEAKETVDNTLSVSTTSIDFADTRIGQTVKKSFTVTNNGSSTLTTRLIFHKAVTVPDLDWEDSGSYISLAPKESKTITLIYLPKGKISGNWELIFETVDMYVESPIVKVTGNGVLASDLNGDTVDLGLSVLWTTCNLGALSPEEYGAYWAWGETSVKANYEWSTYKYCKGTSSTLTKYVRFSDFGYNGFVDNKSKLDPMDDAASVNLDSNYHIPSLAEWKELLENTSHLWTSNYNGTGISGYILTSTVAGYTNNSIFFPAAGYQYPTIAITGRYMTSEKVGSGFDSGCDIVEFQNNRIDGADYNETWGHSSRELGHSIRAVRTK